jgi:hypothetical protein
MSNNLSYSLKEIKNIKNSNSEPDLSWMGEFTDDSICEDEIISSELLLEIEFNEYTLKELQRFCDYYKLHKHKMKKQDVIKQLILFEVNNENKNIVETRRTLWEYFLILKEDPFFKKFIICDI